MSNNTLPWALYQFAQVTPIMLSEENCILYKRLTQSLINQEKVSTAHCLVYVHRGSVEIKTHEGFREQADENELLLMPEDSYTISDFTCHTDTVEVFLVFFSQTLVMEFLHAKNETLSTGGIAPPVLKLKSDKHLQQYFYATMTTYNQRNSNCHLLKIKILECLHLVNRANPNFISETLSASNLLKRRRSIEAIMSNHYDTTLTIADYARLSGRSLSSFNRDFKRKYQKTPKQWLIHKKMAKAKKLLAMGVTVTQCAAEVGYSNVSHFIKAYKLIYGTTPKGSDRRQALNQNHHS